MFNFALNMFTPGSSTYDNGTRSAEKAGYKGKENYLARVASENVRKCKIKAVKRALQKDNAKKIEYNRDKALEMLTTDLEYLTDKAKKGDTRAITARTAIIRELDDICGLKQQNDNRQAVAITIQAPEQPRIDSKPSNEVIAIEQPKDNTTHSEGI